MSLYAIEDTTLTTIADALRAAESSTDPITPEEMPEKIGGVFAAGAKSEYDRFWDAYQREGNYAMYNSAFYGTCWTAETFHPKYPIMIAEQNGLSSTFAYSSIEEINVEIIGIRARWNSTFQYCRKLKRIYKMSVGESATYSGTFTDCDALESLCINGVIGQNGFDVHWSTLLTHDSLMSIINALQDKSGTSGTAWKVTLGDTNLAKLSEEEIGIAEAKGWVLA